MKIVSGVLRNSWKRNKYIYIEERMFFSPRKFKRLMIPNRYFSIPKILFLTFCLLISSRFIEAQQYNYGPRIEIGVGSGLSRAISHPEWSSPHYYSGELTGAYRLIYGLSVQGGTTLNFGDKTGVDWYNYGLRYQIAAKTGTLYEMQWIGARYEIPMSVFKKDVGKVESVYIAGGMSRGDFSLRSKTQKYYKEDYGWQTGSSYNVHYDKVNYSTADFNGYYLAAAARWRVDTVDTDDEDSWIGSYGIDVGMKYNKYYDVEVEYNNLEQAKEAFSSLQLFIILFLKARLFY